MASTSKFIQLDKPINVEKKLIILQRTNKRKCMRRKHKRKTSQLVNSIHQYLNSIVLSTIFTLWKNTAATQWTSFIDWDLLCFHVIALLSQCTSGSKRTLLCRYRDTWETATASAYIQRPCLNRALGLPLIRQPWCCPESLTMSGWWIGVKEEEKVKLRGNQEKRRRTWVLRSEKNKRLKITEKRESRWGRVQSGQKRVKKSVNK